MTNSVFVSLFSWNLFGLDSVRQWPSVPKALGYAAPFDADSFAPFGFAKLFAIKGDHDIGATIRTLLCNCLPLAVVGRVRAIVINSSKTVLRARPFAHILKERFKRYPSFANGYSSLPVTTVAAALWIKTSRLHSSPDVKLRRFCEAVGKSWSHCCANALYFEHLLCRHFAMETSARLRVPISKVRNYASLLSAAVAQAKELSFIRWRALRKNRENNHASVSLTYKIGIGNSNCHSAQFNSTEIEIRKTT